MFWRIPIVFFLINIKTRNITNQRVVYLIDYAYFCQRYIARLLHR
nr:MAG TPA: hypothetical protein [Caudoviricetes sp.]